MGSQRIGHDWSDLAHTHTHTHTCCSTKLQTSWSREAPTVFQVQGFSKHQALSFILTFSLNSDSHPMIVYNYLQFLDSQLRLKKLKSHRLPGSSAGKESACQCRRPWFNSWVRKISWKKDRLPAPVFMGFPDGSDGKESTCNMGDLGSIPGLGRSPGGGHPECPSLTCRVSTTGRPQKSLQTILWLNPFDAQVFIKLINCLNFRQQTYFSPQTLPPMD